MKDTDEINICDKCLRACCLQGYFMCDDALKAGTTKKKVSELKKLGLEHQNYWYQSE